MKAIIPAAGHGTRFLPVTKVVPKEMLPIGSKPALELIVDEAKSAGADEIVLIISHGKELIREYFRDDPAIRFVYQEEQKGLGHAVLMAEESVSNVDSLRGDSSSDHRINGPAGQGRNVLIMLGDCLVAGCNAAKAMAEVSAANGGASVIGLERVPPEKVSRYGIVKPAPDAIEQSNNPNNRTVRILDLVEKPAPSEAPSDLAIAGRYLLSTEIFAFLRTQTPGKGGEIQLTDAIRRMIGAAACGSPNRPIEQSEQSEQSNNVLLGYVYPGKRQDIGNPKGYFEALKAMGANE